MTSADATATDEVELGSIVGVFGVRGEVRVHLHNRQSYLMEGRTKVWLVLPDGTRRNSFIRCRPGAGKRILARVDGPRSRDDAHAMIGTLIIVARGTLPSLEDDEYYVYQLIGLTVRCAGQDVGTITEVHDTAGGDILEIDVQDGPIYVPLTKEIEVSVAEGWCSIPVDDLEEL